MTHLGYAEEHQAWQLLLKGGYTSRLTSVPTRCAGMPHLHQATRRMTPWAVSHSAQAVLLFVLVRHVAVFCLRPQLA